MCFLQVVPEPESEKIHLHIPINMFLKATLTTLYCRYHKMKN